MAWTFTDEEVLNFIKILKDSKYVKDNTVKTGVDNYKEIITLAKELILKRKQEKQLLLNVTNRQLVKYGFFIEKLEQDLSTKGTVSSVSIFQKNVQSASTASSGLTELSGQLVSTVSVEIAKLKKYKRTRQELLAASISLRKALSFYEESEDTLTKLTTELDKP